MLKFFSSNKYPFPIAELTLGTSKVTLLGLSTNVEFLHKYGNYVYDRLDSNKALFIERPESGNLDDNDTLQSIVEDAFDKGKRVFYADPMNPTLSSAEPYVWATIAALVVPNAFITRRKFLYGLASVAASIPLAAGSETMLRADEFLFGNAKYSIRDAISFGVEDYRCLSIACGIVKVAENGISPILACHANGHTRRISYYLCHPFARKKVLAYYPLHLFSDPYATEVFKNPPQKA